MNDSDVNTTSLLFMRLNSSFFFFKELSTNGYANDKKIHENCTSNLDYTLYIESQYVNILHIEIPVSISTLFQKIF